MSKRSKRTGVRSGRVAGVILAFGVPLPVIDYAPGGAVFLRDTERAD